MNKSLKLFARFLIALALIWAVTGLTKEIAQEKTVKIKMDFNNHEAVIAMFDNPAGRDFLTMLPLTAIFEDYDRAEKITYLPRKLTTKGSPTARQLQGDFTYYAPWGNLAIFYKGSGSDDSLYVLGRIISGKDKLAAMDQSFTATIERLE